MPAYRKLPLPVDAVQLRWATWGDVHSFLGDAFLAENPQGATAIPASEASDTCGDPGPDYISLNVRTVHGEIVVVRHGDWIIREDRPGRFYPVKPAVFARTYGPVSGSAELEPGCAHCGGQHSWNSCTAYTRLARTDHDAGLVHRIDGAVRDVLSGASGTFLDCEDAQANALHHMLLSAVAAEVHRKVGVA